MMCTLQCVHAVYACFKCIVFACLPTVLYHSRKHGLKCYSLLACQMGTPGLILLYLSLVNL